MQQIRSGQSFLYRTNGYDSTVVEVRMRDKVTGSYLQIALTNTARRFPYLTQKMVEKDGAYYLHRDDNSMVVNKTDKFRTLGSMATGYHLLDVTYTGSCIRVAFHHGLCDGRGVMPFIETLLYGYCCLKYRKSFPLRESASLESRSLRRKLRSRFPVISTLWMLPLFQRWKKTVMRCRRAHLHQMPAITQSSFWMKPPSFVPPKK